MDENKIKLDVIPIYKGEIYPTKDMIWHFLVEIKNGANREYILKNMFMEIKYKFSDCNTIIVIENGKVIEIL